MAPRVPGFSAPSEGPGAGNVTALQTVALAAAAGRPATKPFSLIGVTWASPRAGLDGRVQVRTRAIGARQWSGWRTLETDGRAPADVRGSSDPLWVGPSDGVEARVTGARRPLPVGLRVDLINPDAEPLAMGESAVFKPQRTPMGRRAAVALPARPVPRMVTRAGWRADERIVKAAPEYTGPTQLMWVHHTATGNGYSCSQSASIVRGIQAYQVRSRGWDDIGYNFLIDKCGTVFEGRAGGVGRTVLGAHTLGFNADTSAIAVIGSYEAQRVTPRVRTVIAAMAAYKLGAYGNPPNGRVVLTSSGGDRFAKGRQAAFFRIAGHRDAGRTACPGNALYAQLPSIRAIAGAAPTGLRLLRMAGAAHAGPWYYTKGAIRPSWTVNTPTALINRFEVWVDGVLRVAAPNAHRVAPIVRLTPGAHTVTLRALHLSGRSTTVSSRVYADTSAPVFTGDPGLTMRPGTVSSTSVPLRLGWGVRDNTSLGSVYLVRPATVSLGVTTRGWNVAAPPNRPSTFSMRAVDRAGNAVNASVTRTPMVVSEVSAQRTGSWRALRNGGYLGGTAVGGSVRGASASWKFSGRSAALVFSRGPRAGRVGVFLDGRPQGLVDLRSSASAPRQVVWSRSLTGSDDHTVRVVVEGTPGRPGVALDGLIYVK